MAPKRSKSAKPSARAAALKRSQAARKAAATRKRNARKGVKNVGPTTVKVDFRPSAAQTEFFNDKRKRNIDIGMSPEFTAMLREEAAKRIKTLLFAQAYSAGPKTLERLSTAPTSDPKLWRTATGAIVHIETMSEEHLRNTVSYLARQLSSRLTSVPFVRALQPMLDSLSAMLSECRRRGLQV